MGSNLTKCRVVRYFPRDSEGIYPGPHEHLAAIVANVMPGATKDDPTLVNLCVIDLNGKTHDRSNVPFVSDCGEGPECGGFAMFTEYQGGGGVGNSALQYDLEKLRSDVSRVFEKITGKLEDLSAGMVGMSTRIVGCEEAIRRHSADPNGDGRPQGVDIPAGKEQDGEPTVGSCVEGVDKEGEPTDPPAPPAAPQPNDIM